MRFRICEVENDGPERIGGEFKLWQSIPAWSWCRVNISLIYNLSVKQSQIHFHSTNVGRMWW